jgi:hypothetical protein
MAGLVPAIHVLSRVDDVDPRNKSGDDDEGWRHDECATANTSLTMPM